MSDWEKCEAEFEQFFSNQLEDLSEFQSKISSELNSRNQDLARQLKIANRNNSNLQSLLSQIQQFLPQMIEYRQNLTNSLGSEDSVLSNQTIINAPIEDQVKIKQTIESLNNWL